MDEVGPALRRAAEIVAPVDGVAVLVNEYVSGAVATAVIVAVGEELFAGGGVVTVTVADTISVAIALRPFESLAVTWTL